MDHALDALDRRLLALLRADARLPTATLARQLHVSRGTVQNRRASTAWPTRKATCC
ncbi:AsnC/Lrp family transcriptional regulator [Bordetella pertussis]|nr:AsnC/Lrp family transcriptional regulator [Bordetella pertussis]